MTQPVKIIDFLPEKYRQATKRRQTSYWRAVVVVLFGAVFAATAGGVFIVERKVQSEYVIVAAKHAAASEADLRLKQKEAKLAELQSYADLITFLRHPWPRSRIVHELLVVLPEGVTIEKLRILSEPKTVAVSEAPAETGEAAAKNVGADLATLRDAAIAADLVVRLEGMTDDQPALHGYLQRLVGPGFFINAEVEQIESVRTGNVRMSKFTARVVVRPGWGMPGGPSETDLPPLHTVEQPTIAALDVQHDDATTSAEALP